MRLASSVQPTAEKNTISEMRIKISTAFSPAPTVSHVQKSNSPQALSSSITVTQTVKKRASFSETDSQPLRRFCSSG